MSRCRFPHQNMTIILDVPSLSHLNTTMLLIETNKNISYTSALSLSCFQKQFEQQDDVYEEDSLGLLIQQESQRETQSIQRKKKYSKNGCTCKKTNCLKMYCQCFSTGKMCTSECACCGCYNQEGHEEHIQVAKEQLKLKGNTSNRHLDRTCNCKKSQCQKKYCECFNAGLSCTAACNCSECCNKQSEDSSLREEEEQNVQQQQVKG